MTDTIEQAQELLLKGDFPAALAMYTRLYKGPYSDEDRGIAAIMLAQMYACGMTGEVNDKLADDFLAKSVKLQSPWAFSWWNPRTRTFLPLISKSW